MGNPLANPLDELVDSAGGKPELIWKVAGAGAGIVGAIVARKLLDRVRLKASDHGDVPLNPGDERMSWPYALVWAGVVGIGASLGRLPPSSSSPRSGSAATAPVSAMPS